MKDSYYFAHDYHARNDIKMSCFIGEFGAAGYGIFWCVTEILHEEESHTIPSSKHIYQAIAKEMATKADQVEGAIKKLIELGLLLEKDGHISSARVNRNIKARLETSAKRSKAGIASAEARYPAHRYEGEDELDDKPPKATKSKVELKPQPLLLSTRNKKYLDGIIEVFQQEYQQSRGRDYVITNQEKERNAVEKLLDIMKKELPEIDSAEGVKTLRHLFRLCLSVEDTWLYNNMSLTVIHSQFNQIQNILNSPKKANNGKVYTYNQLCDLVTKGVEVF